MSSSQSISSIIKKNYGTYQLFNPIQSITASTSTMGTIVNPVHSVTADFSLVKNSRVEKTNRVGFKLIGSELIKVIENSPGFILTKK